MATTIVYIGQTEQGPGEHGQDESVGLARPDHVADMACPGRTLPPGSWSSSLLDPRMPRVSQESPIRIALGITGKKSVHDHRRFRDPTHP